MCSSSNYDRGENFFDVLRNHAATQPDHPAIIDNDRTISYQALNRLTDQGASNLRRRGLPTGAVIAVALPSGADSLLMSCVIARAGYVLYALPQNLKQSAIGSKLNVVNAAAIIVEPGWREISDRPQITVSEIFRPTPEIISEHWAGGDDPAVIGESSGSTGQPKFFALSHDSLMRRSRRFESVLGWSRQERFLNISPLSFFFSRRDCCFILHTGATAVLYQARELSEFVAFVRRAKISHLKLTPIYLRQLLSISSSGKLLFPELRLLTTTSAPITPEERIKARDTLCHDFADSYGANEMGMVARSTPATLRRAPNCVGQIVPDVEAQVVDADHQPLPPGEIGLVRFKAADFPDRYLDNAEATARHFHDGWFYPGDIAAIDGEGLLFLKGRSDDAINNAGITFYPIEIEQVLLRHPDVREAAVLPWRHPLTGEVAVACVVTGTEKTDPDLGKFCKSNLAGPLVPKYILSFKALPKNAMGKILKPELARNLSAILAGAAAKEN